MINRLKEIAAKRFILICIFILFLFLGQSLIYVFFLSSWLDEGNYLARSYWYVTGKVRPYSAEDATWYMPFYFYMLGYWQKLFGMGHVSGRLLSVLLGMLCMVLILRIESVLVNEKWKMLIAPLLFSVTPWGVKYLSTATPYAAVSFLSLLLFYVIIKKDEMASAVFIVVTGLLFCALYFLRNNMILGIVIFSAFIWVRSEGKKPFFSVLGPLLVFLAAAFILLMSFPEKLTYFAFRLPFVMEFIDRLPAFSRYSIVETNTYTISEAVGLLQGIRETGKAFTEHYMREYLLVVVLSVIAVIHSVKRRDFKDPLAFSSMYFVGMSILHFIGSQGYCRSCIRPYTNYFFAFGCLGSVYAIGSFGERDYRLLTKRKGLRNLLLLFTVVVFVVLSISHLDMMMSDPRNSYIKQVKGLSLKVERSIPEHEKVLVIGGLPITTQALYYAERDFEISAIFQNHFNRKLKCCLSPDEKRKTLAGIGEMSYWSDELMEFWIREKYNYILSDEGKTFTRFSPLIHRYFARETELGSGKKKKYAIYKRKSYPQPEML